MSGDEDLPSSVMLEDLLEDARYSQAEQMLAGIFNEYPGETWALTLRAVCLSELGRSAEALNLAEDATIRSPGDSHAHWIFGVLLCAQDRLNPALEAARTALQLDATDSRYFALIAQIHAKRERWEQCKDYAEKGLELDPDDEACAALRTLALRSTSSGADWSKAIDDLTHQYPASGWARAGKGWGLLEKGQAGDARGHFEQALALDPTSEWAMHGLMESIKAHNPVYASLLRIFLWLDRLPPRTRWLVVLGGLFAVRALGSAARENPSLEPIAYPVIGLWIFFVVASWTAYPLSNFVLSRTAAGRRLVRGDDLVGANSVAALLASALALAAIGAVAASERAFLAAACAAFLIVPLSAVFQCRPGWPRTTMAVYASLIGLVFMVGLAGPIEGTRVALGAVILMSVLGTWIGAFLTTRLPTR